MIKIDAKGNETEHFKYQHVERLGTDEVDGIEAGKCYVFYKIDGTAGSVWKEDGEICCGSRNRRLSLENDNRGFMNYCLTNANIEMYLADHPDHVLFGEWLVPHSLKTYRDEAWRKFYIYDVALIKDDGTFEYLPYDIYQQLLEWHSLDYIPPLRILKNPDKESLYKCLNETGQFLVKDGEGIGEGIVIKNYDFYNRYGRQTWAKIVCNEFKEKHRKAMGAPEGGTISIEEKIVDKYITAALVEKEYAKIVNAENGWKSQYIPRLLNTVWYELINEEMCNILKAFKPSKIDFKFLQSLVTGRVKQIKSDLFM